MKDGGPAFPIDHDIPGLTGMSLRDYFAAAVLPSLLDMMDTKKDTTEMVVRSAYLVADAMLLERQKLQGGVK